MPEETTVVEPLPFPFATVPQLKERWPDMPSGSEAVAGVLLEDASQFILDIAPSAKDAHPNTRKRVVCAVVKRSLQMPEDMAGLSSSQVTTGPFHQQRSPVNPHGDFYLTRLEKKALGVGRQALSEVDLLAGSRGSWERWEAANDVP